MFTEGSKPHRRGGSGTGRTLPGGREHGVRGLKQAGGRLVQRETPFLALGLHSIHPCVLAVKSLKKNLIFLSLFRKVL